MRVKSVLTVGFLAAIAAITGVTASESVAADVQRKVHRVDVIDQPPADAQKDSATITQSKSMRADVIDNIGAGGPSYVYSKSGQRVDVIDRIPAGGPTYAYTKPMSH